MTTVDKSTLEKIITNKGRSLLAISNDQPVLLIFLRHFGCIFCREAMNDISKEKSEFLKKGVSLVMVHMADTATAEEYFEKYGLKDIEHVSDPECFFYDEFGLLKGNFNQLYGLQVWLRGIQTSIKDGNSFSLKQIGDGLQMPGIFYVYKGQIRDEYIHSKISDRPDYQNMIDCCVL